MATQGRVKGHWPTKVQKDGFARLVCECGDKTPFVRDPKRLAQKRKAHLAAVRG